MPRALLHPFAKPSTDQFITLVRGDGARVYTADGRELIDGMAALWFCAIGHGRQEMADAIGAQAAKLASYSIFDPFTNDPAEELAEKLVTIAPVDDSRVFLTCSGSEAVDTAMKLARLSHVLNGQPQRQLIISRTRGYHGTAYGGTSAQGIAPNREGYGALLPEVIQVPSDDIEAVASLMAERGAEVAGVVTEPVQGAGGVWPAEEGYLQGLRRLCDQHGAFLIFDEVICGFGRLGTWFGAHHYGVQPDLATFAKAVTSGYQPVGGVFVGPAARAGLEADPNFFLRHGFTYSGHATACVAALKNLEIIEREDLVGRAKPIGERLSAGLLAMQADGLVASVRGTGAIWAVGHHDGVDSTAIRNHMADLGVITRALPGTNTFCPPLVITDAEIDKIVDALETATRAALDGSGR